MKSDSHPVSYALVELAVIKQNTTLALRIAQPLLNQCDAPTQWFIGYLYDNGYFGEANSEEAHESYRKSAAQGFARAQLAFGKGYEEDEVEWTDSEQGRIWFREGVKVAGDNLSKLTTYAMPGCSREDRLHALKVLREDATRGVREAQIILGMLYEHGLLVRKDNERALEWYSSAAEEGLAEARLLHAELSACHWLDKYHEEKTAREELILKASREKLGCPPTGAVEAFEWYRKLADEGHPDAQWELFKAYWNGRGVRKNEIVAFKWMILACERHPDEEVRTVMEDHRQTLAAILHLDFDKSERMARKWTPKSVAVDAKVG